MNNSIYPCVWFNGNAKEAADFYSRVFPNTKTTVELGIVIIMELNGQKLMLLNGGPEFQPNASISFLIANEDEKETERLYNTLAEDGIALMPLDSYPFSKKYGWVRDKFGVTWQLYTGSKGNTDQYFTTTLMFLHEQNGRAKEAIAFYTELFPESNVEGILEYDGAEDIKGNVQHAQFNISGYTLGAMDSSIDHKFDFSEGISLVVDCNTQAEIDNYWKGLTYNGGKESKCGWLEDSFGVSWQIVPNIWIDLLSNPEKAQRTMQVVLRSTKLNMEEMKNA